MLTETSNYDTNYTATSAGTCRHGSTSRPPAAIAMPMAPNRLALIYVDEDGSAQRTSFDEMRALSSRFANVLKADGLKRGDRVAAFLSQSLELPIVHLAAFRSGLVSVPLFTLFGEDALEFRLANSGAKAVVTDESGWEKLSQNPRSAALPSGYLRHQRGRSRRRQIVLVVDRNGVRGIRHASIPPLTILPSSSTPRARQEIQKARCTPIACCSAICPMSRWCMISCRRRAT